GELSLDDVLVWDNWAGGRGVEGELDSGIEARGGGIYSEGGLTVVDSTFLDNRASDVPLWQIGEPYVGEDGYGGGIWNDGTRHIVGSTVAGNKIIGPASSTPLGLTTGYLAGGAIYSTWTGTLDMTRTVVRLNYTGVGNPAPYIIAAGGGLFFE